MKKMKMKLTKFNLQSSTYNWNFNVRREQSASSPTLVHCTSWLRYLLT